MFEDILVKHNKGGRNDKKAGVLYLYIVVCLNNNELII